MGCFARRTDGHHLARRRDRYRRVSGAWGGRAQRGGRAHDHDGGTCAALSGGAHRVFRRLRTARSMTAQRKPSLPCACSRASASPRSASCWRQIARYRRERTLHQGTGLPKPGERWLIVTSALRPRSIMPRVDRRAPCCAARRRGFPSGEWRMGAEWRNLTADPAARGSIISGGAVTESRGPPPCPCADDDAPLFGSATATRRIGCISGPAVG